MLDIKAGEVNDRGKLGNFLGEVIHWRWDEFCLAELDPKYSGIEASIFKLVRACSDGKLSAINLAIDRIDGKVETPVRIEYPRVWLTFPEATGIEGGETVSQTDAPRSNSKELIKAPEGPKDEADPEKPLATMTLRETLKKMADETRQLPFVIHEKKKEVEQLVKNREPVNPEHAPLVKSVIAANLLLLATEAGKFEAITAIFEQIDGKLVETIRILGDDIYLAQYTALAPRGAIKNKDGIYMIEAAEAQETWKQKLKKD